MKVVGAIFDWTFGSAFIGLAALLGGAMAISVAKWVASWPPHAIAGLEAIAFCFVVGTALRLIWRGILWVRSKSWELV